MRKNRPYGRLCLCSDPACAAIKWGIPHRVRCQNRHWVKAAMQSRKNRIRCCFARFSQAELSGQSGTGRMTADHKDMKRREFLTAVGKAVGSSALLRTMTAMGIGTSLASCGSSSAAPGAAPNPPAPSPPPPLQSPRPGDWPSNVGVGKSVVILGGGIAGMTAANEMTKLGYSCTILDSHP